MTCFEIFTVAIALSMDAFSVAVCKGLTLRSVSFKNSTIVGLYFGMFQSLMPLIGYFLASFFTGSLQNLDNFIAFVLLSCIGLQMIVNNLRGKPIEEYDEFAKYKNDKMSLSFKAMLPLAIATSIDALAVGVSFAMLKINIVHTVLVIGLTTFFVSAVGVKIGSYIGNKFSKYAEILGGIILIIIGISILDMKS